MVFSSVIFLFAFLPVMLLFYYISPDKIRNLILFVFSLIFYAWGEPIYVFLMLYSIFMNYVCGLLMEKHRNAAKEILVFAVIINILIIGFFKYAGFLVENISALTGCEIKMPELALPIGISFYTFQALSYIIDLYRGKYHAQKNFISFGAYITMFPQLIAGPIVRYESIQAELDSKKKTDLYNIGRGASRFILGLGKKVLIANQVGAIFDTIQLCGGEVSTGMAWIGAIAYTLQIYFDFSGYSDMAIGLGRMMGFTFCENFDHPYMAVSVTDFWRRWHISLSSWFKEYVYIPLGGNRRGAVRHIRNILIVWFLTGLWHGAAWNFIIWGMYYGLLLLIEKYVLLKVKWPGFISRPFTILCIIVGWVIFSSDSMSSVINTLSAMFSEGKLGWWDSNASYYLMTNIRILLVALLCCFPFVKPFVQFLEKNIFGRMIIFIMCAAVLVFCTAFMATESYNPFLYFQF